MEELISKLGLKKIVLVSPSMSGKYGLPFLLHAQDPDLVGFVAIAPTGTAKYRKEDYQQVDIPVLVMWGERDQSEHMKETEYWMANIPDHTRVMIPRAEHAAFVGNPKDFHSEILRFLTKQISIGEDSDTVFARDEDTGGGWFGESDSDYADSDTMNGYELDTADFDTNMYIDDYAELGQYFEDYNYDLDYDDDFFGKFDMDTDTEYDTELDTDTDSGFFNFGNFAGGLFGNDEDTLDDDDTEV
jgi:hypothetical protein